MIEAPTEPPKHVNPLITFDDFLPEVGKISQRAQRDLKTNYKLQKDDVRKKTQYVQNTIANNHQD